MEYHYGENAAYQWHDRFLAALFLCVQDFPGLYRYIASRAISVVRSIAKDFPATLLGNSFEGLVRINRHGVVCHFQHRDIR